MNVTPIQENCTQPNTQEVAQAPAAATEDDGHYYAPTNVENSNTFASCHSLLDSGAPACFMSYTFCKKKQYSTHQQTRTSSSILCRWISTQGWYHNERNESARHQERRCRYLLGQNFSNGGLPNT